MFDVLRVFARRFASPPAATALTALERNDLYDRQTIAVMERVLRPDSSGVDVGAAHGTFLIPLLRIAPHGTHYAFEALPHFAAHLRHEFPTVLINECALSNRRGTSSFEYVTNDPGYSGLRRREYFRDDVVIEQIAVKTETLDHVIPGDAAVDFIKIDVEGGEYDVMMGGVALIKRRRPVIVFEASVQSTGFYGVTADQLHGFITNECGMTLSTMDRWLNGRPGYSAAEFRTNWQFGPEFYFIAYP